MGEGTVFSLFVSPHLGGGTPVRSRGWGVPHPRSGCGGTPSQVWPVGWGVPIPGLAGGVPHPRSRGRGYPIPGLDGGYPGYPPTRSGQGTPLTRSEWGTPPDLGWGPPWTWDGVPPSSDLGWGTLLDLGWGTLLDLGHSEHLLRGGRYASCVHAGGLPCLV